MDYSKYSYVSIFFVHKMKRGAQVLQKESFKYQLNTNLEVQL